MRGERSGPSAGPPRPAQPIGLFIGHSLNAKWLHPGAQPLVEAFKRALLNAKSISYHKVGSGAYLAQLFDRLGIAEAIAPKVTRPDTDIVSELVAKGEIELGMVVITQIMTTPGVELVGPRPRS